MNHGSEISAVIIYERDEEDERERAFKTRGVNAAGNGLHSREYNCGRPRGRERSGDEQHNQR